MRDFIGKEWVKFLFASILISVLPLLYFKTQDNQFDWVWLSLIIGSTLGGFAFSFFKSTSTFLYNFIVLISSVLHFIFYYNVVWMQGLDIFNIMYFIVLTFAQVLLYSELQFSYYAQGIIFLIPLSLIFLAIRNAYDKPYVWLFLDAIVKTIALFLTYFSIKTQSIQKMLDYKSRYVNKIREEEELLRKDLDDSYRTLFKNKSKFQTKKLEWTEELEKRMLYQEMHQQKSDFIAQINHLVKNSANSIFGIIDILRAKQKDNDSKDLLKTIKKNTYEVLSIVNSIIEFSSIENQSKLILKKPHTFNKVVKSIEAFLQIQSKKKNKEFSLLKDPSIPEFLSYDYDKVHKVLKLIIEGVADWIDDDQIKIKLELLEKETIDEYLIRFEFIILSSHLTEEVGKGLLDKKIQYQNIIESVKNRRQINKDYNFIIANAIIQSLAEQGLQIEYFENYAKMTFDLPFGKLSMVDQIKLKKSVFNKRDNKLQDAKVLLVEDNKTNMMVAKLMLESIGAKVLTAANGIECLDQYKAYKDEINIVLMDIQMPVMDGLSATNELRSLYGEIPKIIALTASDLDNADMHYSLLGFDAYIGKPIEKVKLINVLEQVFIEKG